MRSIERSSHMTKTAQNYANQMTLKYIILNTNSTITIINRNDIDNTLGEPVTQTKMDLPWETRDTVYFYCGQCSGVCLRNSPAPIVQCFHCQHKYQIECLRYPINLTGKMHHRLPNTVINFIRLKGLANFNQSSLLKTRKKEDYRRLYEYLVEKGINSEVPPSLIQFVSKFSDIVKDQKFTDDLLENLNSEYFSLLKFSMDAYHLI